MIVTRASCSIGAVTVTGLGEAQGEDSHSSVQALHNGCDPSRRGAISEQWGVESPLGTWRVDSSGLCLPPWDCGMGALMEGGQFWPVSAFLGLWDGHPAPSVKCFLGMTEVVLN